LWEHCGTVLDPSEAVIALVPACPSCMGNGRGKIPVVIRGSENMKGARLGVVFVTKDPPQRGRPFLEYSNYAFAEEWCALKKVSPSPIALTINRLTNSVLFYQNR
jgi:hypothetical protein